MADKEYIERDAAIHAIQNDVPIGQFMKRSTSTAIHAMGTVCATIHAIPAADVVKVVRCRECRFAPSGTDDSVEQGFGLEWPDDNWLYHTNPCPFWCEDEYYSQKPKPDFFCAFGKRKDGEQDDA